MKYYVVFGQGHTHPDTNEQLKDYWIEIEAEDDGSFRDVSRKIKERFGLNWSRFFEDRKFNKAIRSFFPKGNYEAKEHTKVVSLDDMFEMKVKGII